MNKSQIKSNARLSSIIEILMILHMLFWFISVSTQMRKKNARIGEWHGLTVTLFPQHSGREVRSLNSAQGEFFACKFLYFQFFHSSETQVNGFMFQIIETH